MPESLRSSLPRDWTPIRLPPHEEQKFVKWLSASGWFTELVESVNRDRRKRGYGEVGAGMILSEILSDPKPDYDYRRAFRSGVKPERDPYDDNRFHWPSRAPSGEWLKSPNHPTAWKEVFMERTGENPDALGLRSIDEADLFLQRKMP